LINEIEIVAEQIIYDLFFKNLYNVLYDVYIYIYIGLSGKFVPLKENLNAENLNFSIHLLNYID